ncbi:hypothetical protein ALC56_02645 [Trachymyrmex septentrionalis]|uniref:Uncharacterized protein n=1 Tax=Trachymyrmex septentrionalis TaxID=34720 RepID=A0A195FQU7_9HYME|nr:hypothetical protein ALC56_02645 [Trachymyrmex septentrionalis]
MYLGRREGAPAATTRIVIVQFAKTKAHPVLSVREAPLDISRGNITMRTRMQIHLDMHFNTNYGDTSFSKTLCLNQRRTVMMLPIARFGRSQYIF